jgi:hypothetical protein
MEMATIVALLRLAGRDKFPLRIMLTVSTASTPGVS